MSEKPRRDYKFRELQLERVSDRKPEIALVVVSQIWLFPRFGFSNPTPSLSPPNQAESFVGIGPREAGQEHCVTASPSHTPRCSTTYNPSRTKQQHNTPNARNIQISTLFIAPSFDTGIMRCSPIRLLCDWSSKRKKKKRGLPVVAGGTGGMVPSSGEMFAMCAR